MKRSVGQGIMNKLPALTVLSLLLVGCGAQPSRYPYAKEPNPQRDEYVIGAADALRITVWKNNELNTEIEVRPDGTITMPLVGDIHAAGMTPTQLKNEIAKRLQNFIREEGAYVTVAVTNVNSYRFTVSGNVTLPGMFSSRQYVTVVEAIALAGGPNRFASPSEMVLIRKDESGRVRRIPIDYEAIMAGRAPEQNLIMLRGDTLYVP
jgi:polysaccharide export outer membrane protein